MRFLIYSVICQLTSGSTTQHNLYEKCGVDGTSNEHVELNNLFNKPTAPLRRSEIDQVCHIAHTIGSSKSELVANLITDLKDRIQVRKDFEREYPRTAKQCPPPVRRFNYTGNSADKNTLDKFEQVFNGTTLLGHEIIKKLDRVQKGEFCEHLAEFSRNPLTGSSIDSKLVLLRQRVHALLPTKKGVMGWLRRVPDQSDHDQ